MNEDDSSNSTWQPVVKPKRISKSKPTQKEAPPNNNGCDKPKSILLSSSTVRKGAPSTESEPSDRNPSVIATICDKPKPEPIGQAKSPVNVPISDIKPEKTPLKQHEEDDDEEQEEGEEDQQKVTEENRNASESPTNSLSDDFELVDVYKTSSEDGLRVEIDIDPTESDSAAQPAAISATSGASRKKNKKQQKLISRQLIEAAAIDAAPKQPTDSFADKAKSVAAVTVAAAAAAKKKRPRKDV